MKILTFSAVVIVFVSLTAGCQALNPSDVQYPANPSIDFKQGYSVNSITYSLAGETVDSKDVNTLKRVNYSKLLDDYMRNYYVSGSGNSNLHIEIYETRISSPGGQWLPWNFFRGKDAIRARTRWTDENGNLLAEFGSGVTEYVRWWEFTTKKHVSDLLEKLAYEIQAETQRTAFK